MVQNWQHSSQYPCHRDQRSFGRVTPVWQTKRLGLQCFVSDEVGLNSGQQPRLHTCDTFSWTTWSRKPMERYPRTAKATPRRNNADIFQQAQSAEAILMRSEILIVKSQFTGYILPMKRQYLDVVVEKFIMMVPLRTSVHGFSVHGSRSQKLKKQNKNNLTCKGRFAK